MPTPYKVKFNENGGQCPRTIRELRRNPECGILFREEQPFKPANNPKFPLPKNQIEIRKAGNIPESPVIPRGIMPKSGMPYDDDPRRLAFKRELLPQDNIFQIKASRNFKKASGYELIPDEVILNELPVEIELQESIKPKYNNQEPDRVTPKFKQSRISLVPDNQPQQQMSSKKRGKMKMNNIELFAISPEMEDEFILKLAEQYKGKVLTQNQVDEIVKEGILKNISREKTLQILKEADLYTQFEIEINELDKIMADKKMSSTKEKALLRNIKSSIDDLTLRQTQTNLKPYNERQEEIELREDTPLTQGRTDIAAGRSRFKKLIDKTAGKLDPEFRFKAKEIFRGRTDDDFSVVEETVFEKTKASLTTETKAYKRAQLELLGLKEKIGKSFDFKKYEAIKGTDFELADLDSMRLRIPEENVSLGDLTDIPLNPLNNKISSRKLTKLSFAERISVPKVSDIATGSVGGLGGLGFGFGISQLLDQAKVNKYLNAVISTGSGDVGGRILTYSAESIALKTGFRTAEVASLTTSTLARGFAEGGAIGLATMPLDMFLNSSLRGAGLSHTASNMISTGTVSTGTIAAIWGAGAANTVDTLGTSLIVSGLVVGSLELIAFLTGQNADKQIEQHNSKNKVRSEFLDTLKEYDYDYKQALNNFKNKDGLGMKDDDWDSWSNNLNNVFTRFPKPNATIKPDNKLGVKKGVTSSGSGVLGKTAEDNSGLSKEDKLKMQQYFSKYMIHNIIKKVCSGKNDCSSDLTTQDKGELNENEINFLNDKTDRTWQSQADMQVNYSIKEMEYTNVRVQEAKNILINNWETNKMLPSQLEDKDVEKLANLDPNFKNAFDNAVKLDSQRAVVQAYMTSQTKMENLPENIQKMANLDKDFYYHIHVYYRDIENTAGRMNLSVYQLIQLQGMPQDKQNKKYREFQFDYAKLDDKTVSESISISKEEDTVREAGYYDIDEAYLKTDPTAVGNWKPSDSQILQAHSAGMTLQQYVNYMHELSLGTAGDFTKLPNYDKNEIRSSGILDFSHFEDELQIAGFDKNMYSYNPDTLTITLNNNVSAIPSTQNKFISNYTVENLNKTRQETADLIHGYDQQSQGIIDNYNSELRRHLSVFGDNYNKQVASINENRSYHGINNLLIYDENAAYASQHIEFKPILNKSVLENKPVINKPVINLKDPDNVAGNYTGAPIKEIESPSEAVQPVNKESYQSIFKLVDGKIVDN